MVLRLHFLILTGALAVVAPVVAMEVSSEGDERAVVRAMAERADQRKDEQDAQLTAMLVQHENLKACLAKGMFYAPGKTGADAKGCIEIDF